MSDIGRVLSTLSKVRSNGRDRWMACCPAHSDKEPSLSVRLYGDRVLLNCFAGCGGVDVMHATGLDMDCFAPRGVLKKEVNSVESIFGPRPTHIASDDDYFLEVAKAKRKAGERLTESEKKREFDIFRRKTA